MALKTQYKLIFFVQKIKKYISESEEEKLRTKTQDKN